ncbi:hypothetical protein ACFLY4_05225 [Chloroflexota bacterium]
MLRLLLLISLAVIVLSGCASPTPVQPVTDDQDSLLVTVYRSPT